jgi:hypothetical protein
MVTGPNADRCRCDLAGELAVPLADDALVAPLGDEIVMLIPAPEDAAAAGAEAASDGPVSDGPFPMAPFPMAPFEMTPSPPRTSSPPGSAARSPSSSPTVPGSGSLWG